MGCPWSPSHSVCSRTSLKHVLIPGHHMSPLTLISQPFKTLGSTIFLHSPFFLHVFNFCYFLSLWPYINHARILSRVHIWCLSHNFWWSPSLKVLLVSQWAATTLYSHSTLSKLRWAIRAMAASILMSKNEGAVLIFGHILSPTYDYWEV